MPVQLPESHILTKFTRPAGSARLNLVKTPFSRPKTPTSECRRGLTLTRDVPRKGSHGML
jgi:hypothetical protein